MTTKFVESIGTKNKGLVFWCPGCKAYHRYVIEPKGDYSGPVWQWNGDMEKPTLSPSLLVTYHDGVRRCHLFVHDGMIDFLGDCHHDLRGQTVPMEEAEA
jgi:hypothetical protein